MEYILPQLLMRGLIGCVHGVTPHSEREKYMRYDDECDDVCGS